MNDSGASILEQVNDLLRRLPPCSNPQGFSVVSERDLTDGKNMTLALGRVSVRPSQPTPQLWGEVCAFLQEEGKILDIRSKELCLGAFPDVATKTSSAVSEEMFETLRRALQQAWASCTPDDLIDGMSALSFSFPMLVNTWNVQGLPVDPAFRLKPPIKAVRVSFRDVMRMSKKIDRPLAKGFRFGRFQLFLDLESETVWLRDDDEKMMWQIIWSSDMQANSFRVIDGDPVNAEAFGTWVANSLKFSALDEKIRLPPPFEDHEQDEASDESDDFDCYFVGMLSEWFRFQHRGLVVFDRRLQGGVVETGGPWITRKGPNGEPESVQAPAEPTPQCYAAFMREFVLDMP